MAKRPRKANDEVLKAEAAARLAAGVADSPPAPAGTPAPAAGDGQGGAGAQKNKNRVALYLRVSTRGQTVENQERELREVADRAGWQIVRIYKDEGISGSKGRNKRPAFDAMLNAAVRREFDMVAAWSVDRLGRSLQDLVSSLSELHAVGCNLFLLKQNIDTTTPSGQAMFQMMGVFAQFERAIIVERVKAGLAVAQSKGKRLGKAPTPPETIAAIKVELANGTGVLKIGRMFKVGTATVQRIKKEMTQ